MIFGKVQMITSQTGRGQHSSFITQFHNRRQHSFHINVHTIGILNSILWVMWERKVSFKCHNNVILQFNGQGCQWPDHLECSVCFAGCFRFKKQQTGKHWCSYVLAIATMTSSLHGLQVFNPPALTPGEIHVTTLCTFLVSTVKYLSLLL